MVRKYRNTIQNPYAVASAANASGSLQTALSKVTRHSAIAHTRSVYRRVTSDRDLTFRDHNRDISQPTSVLPMICPERRLLEAYASEPAGDGVVVQRTDLLPELGLELDEPLQCAEPGQEAIPASPCHHKSGQSLEAHRKWT